MSDEGGRPMTLDLEAIRARDAALGDLTTWPNESGNTASEDMLDAMQAIIDRRALLAEVDRLRDKVDRMGEVYEAGEAGERARALPVIEAARALVENSTAYKPLYEEWDALRAALAEWEEGK